MSSKRQKMGMSLIEVVVFIVVLGIGLSGMLVLYSQITRVSVDPIVRKQALAIASSLLEEIELRAFTFCDPDDSNVYTAGNAAACTIAEVLPACPPATPANEQAESRYGPVRFDNVNDYNCFSMTGSIRDITNTAIAGLDDYTAIVSIVDFTSNPTELPGVAVPSDALRITVTAAHPLTGISVSLQGYRLRYAPNSP
jgi:MSHA pilin protein MshD